MLGVIWQFLALLRVSAASVGVTALRPGKWRHCGTPDPIIELCADSSTFLPDRKLDEDVNALLQ